MATEQDRDAGTPGKANETARGLGALAMEQVEPRAPRAVGGPQARQVDEIKRRLDLLLDVHAETDDFGAGAPVRGAVEKKIAALYAQCFGASPRKRRRLALMLRLDRVTMRPAARPTPAEILSGAHDGLTLADLVPVLRVWSSAPGAKRDGGVSKWVALSRVLQRCWDDPTKPATLEREYRDAKGRRRDRG